jgi:POT family proton-dependent oligopeptide transporter
MEALSKYRTTPEQTDRMPGGIPYIISNECAERFSFYGMRSILVVFMTQHLLGADGQLAVMNEGEAKQAYHLFAMAAYLTPIFGAFISDAFLGKYRTIMLLSVVYVFGHFALALDETRTGLYIGLGLIALGAGGIKPCVSAHVGDQFGAANEHLLPRVFAWFYFSINLGAAISTVLTPVLLRDYGAGVAFGVPGILMFLATVAFWMGRNKFVHIPPGGSVFVREAFSGEGLRVILKLSLIFAFISVFWSLFDQTGSAWVIQADKMDRFVGEYELLPSQIQAANPFLILILIPIINFLVYPAIDRIFLMTPLRKITIGLFVGSAPFFILGFAQGLIDAGGEPHIMWQVVAYVPLTAAEVMISITAIEFAYTQAPKTMKSVIMTLYLVSMSLGNGITFAVNFFIQNEDGSSKLEGASYFFFFAVLMVVTAALFIGVAMMYKEKRYIQGDEA